MSTSLPVTKRTYVIISSGDLNMKKGAKNKIYCSPCVKFRYCGQGARKGRGRGRRSFSLVARQLVVRSWGFFRLSVVSWAPRPQAALRLCANLSFSCDAARIEQDWQKWQCGGNFFRLCFSIGWNVMCCINEQTCQMVNNRDRWFLLECKTWKWVEQRVLESGWRLSRGFEGRRGWRGTSLVTAERLVRSPKLICRFFPR